MPYLSKVRINPFRETGRRLMRNPHIVHGMVTGGVPDAPTTERTLWRLDTTDPRRPELLILTDSKPDWTHIVEQAGWPHAGGEHFAVRDYTPLFTHLAVSREYAFRLTASPVQNTKSPNKLTPAQQQQRDQGGTRGFRIGHRTAAHQLEWLLSRTRKWGFTIPEARSGLQADDGDPSIPAPRDVRITARDIHRFRKKDGGILVTLTTATFEGRMVITDTDLLREALLTGIGPSKAYGCGLLTLAPLHGRHHG